MRDFLKWFCVFMAVIFLALGEYVAYYAGIVSWPALLMAGYFAFLAHVHSRPGE